MNPEEIIRKGGEESGRDRDFCGRSIADKISVGIGKYTPVISRELGAGINM
jgi:hypothetical protein